MHIIDILKHGKCSVLLFPHKFHNYNKNLRVLNNFLNFVNLPKREKAHFNCVLFVYKLLTSMKQLYRGNDLVTRKNGIFQGLLKYVEVVALLKSIFSMAQVLLKAPQVLLNIQQCTRVRKIRVKQPTILRGTFKQCLNWQ